MNEEKVISMKKYEKITPNHDHLGTKMSKMDKNGVFVIGIAFWGR